MSQFKNKMSALRLTQLQQPETDPTKIRHVCSAEIKLRGHCSNSPRIQTPIIICKKQKKEENKKQFKAIKEVKIENKKPVKKVQPFVPIDIPISPRSKFDTKFKSLYDNTQTSTPSGQKQIEIHIEKEMKDNKECLRKLFKKIHQLSEDLAESQKERIRLQLELNNLKDVDGFNRNQQKDMIKMEGDNYKLRSDIDFLKELLKQRNEEILGLKNKVPSQIIKQIVVEKPVEVRVEVPKYVAGPEKIIEIPTYVQNKSHEREVESMQRKIKELESELLNQKKRNMGNERKPIIKQVQVPVPTIVEKPVYLDKPIYIDRPIYIEKPIQKQRFIEVPREVPRQITVEVPVEVPIEVPVYIEKPVADQEMYYRLRQLQRDMELFVNQNQQLKHQNYQLRNVISCLQSNIQVLRRHNCQKNHEVQVLLKNTDDYLPIDMKEIIKKETKILGRNTPIHMSFNPNY